MRTKMIAIIIVCLVGTPFFSAAGADTIQPGTRLELTEKLEIKDQLVVKGSEADPAVISIPNPLRNAASTIVRGPVLLKTGPELKELEIQPYSVETEEIVDELEAFRQQYAFVWVVLMGIQIYLVLNRTTYW